MKRHFLPVAATSASISSNTVDLPTPGSPIPITFVPGKIPPSVLNSLSVMFPVFIGVKSLSSNFTFDIFTNFNFFESLVGTLLCFLARVLIRFPMINHRIKYARIEGNDVNAITTNANLNNSGSNVK